MKSHWLINLINLHDENRKLHRQVAELSWDEPFGMLTRPAFLQYCRQLPGRLYWVAFIDMNNIGSLNLSYGYVVVDRRIRTLFADFFDQQDIVARWYSGDEIVILFAGSRNPQTKIMGLACKARKVELDFIFQVGVWDSSCELIVETINKLSSIAGTRKNNLKMTNQEVPIER